MQRKKSKINQENHVDLRAHIYYVLQCISAFLRLFPPPLYFLCVCVKKCVAGDRVSSMDHSRTHIYSIYIL
jgi:hypothetical protein